MMTFTYDLNTNGCLIIRATPEEREALKELATEQGEFTANAEYDALESLIANSELDWIAPEEIGALTSAPILGFRDTERELLEGADSRDVHIVGRWEGKDGKLHTYYEPVRSAWGFMDYQVRSFVKDLIETGQAIFVS